MCLFLIGTTNVLALDVLRVFGSGKESMELYVNKIESCVKLVPVGHGLIPATKAIRRSLEDLQEYVKKLSTSLVSAEDSCRELMMTMGYVLSSALLVEHAVLTMDSWHTAAAKRWSAMLEESLTCIRIPTDEERAEDLALAMGLTIEDAKGRIKGKLGPLTAAQIVAKF